MHVIAPEGKIILEQLTVTTDSGIEIPEDTKKEPRVGIVYDYGKPKKDDPQISLKKGQKVCIKKYVTSPFYVPELNKNLIFIDYDDVVGIFVEDK